MTQQTFLATALALTIGGVISLGAQGIEPALAWQRDCVGRFTLELPGEVDVAMPRLQRFLGLGSTNMQYLFPSETTGQTWGDKQAAGSQLESGPSADANVFAAARTEMDAIYSARIRELRAQSRDDDADEFQHLSTDLPDTHVWTVGNSKHYLLLRDGRLFSVYDDGKDDAFYKPRVSHVASTVRSRQVFEVPAQPGLCLHYGFLPDDGSLRRDIGITYRLKAHPEIEILFWDRSAYQTPTGYKEKSDSREVQFFWEDDNPVRGKQVRLLSPHVPGMMQFPDVKMGGFTGKRSFVEITRQNGTVDYGYMAFVKGDPSAKDDKPDLLLYVIRDVSKAKGKPLDRGEVEAIGDHIAASIRRH